MIGFLFSKLVLLLYVILQVAYHLAEMMFFSVFFIPLFIYAHIGAFYYKVRCKPCRSI